MKDDVLMTAVLVIYGFAIGFWIINMRDTISDLRGELADMNRSQAAIHRYVSAVLPPQFRLNTCEKCH